MRLNFTNFKKGNSAEQCKWKEAHKWNRYLSQVLLFYPCSQFELGKLSSNEKNDREAQNLRVKSEMKRSTSGSTSPSVLCEQALVSGFCPQVLVNMFLAFCFHVQASLRMMWGVRWGVSHVTCVDNHLRSLGLVATLLAPSAQIQETAHRLVLQLWGTLRKSFPAFGQERGWVYTPCPAYSCHEGQLDGSQGTHHTRDTSCRFLEGYHTHPVWK